MTINSNVSTCLSSSVVFDNNNEATYSSKDDAASSDVNSYMHTMPEKDYPQACHKKSKWVTRLFKVKQFFNNIAERVNKIKNKKSSNHSVLLDCILANDIVSLEERLKHTHSINYQPPGQDKNTLLHIAIQQECPKEIIKLLLFNGADLDLANRHGKTARDLVRELDDKKLKNYSDFKKLLCDLYPQNLEDDLYDEKLENYFSFIDQKNPMPKFLDSKLQFHTCRKKYNLKNNFLNYKAIEFNYLNKGKKLELITVDTDGKRHEPEKLENYNEIINQLQQKSGQVRILKYESRDLIKKHLNCVAKRSDNGEEIECRHLALGMIERSKQDFNLICTPEKLSENSPRILPSQSELEQKFYEKTAKESVFFNIKDFNQALSHIVASHWSKMTVGQSEPFLLFSHESPHMMGLSLEKRHGAMKIKFYDPNDTLTFHMLVIEDPAHAVHIRIDDFLSEDDIEDYFGSMGSNNASCALLSKATVDSDDKASHTLIGDYHSVSLSQVMTFYGQQNIVKQLVQQIIHNNQPAQLLDIYKHKAELVISCLSIALQKGCADTVQVYLDTILTSGLFNDKPEELLALLQANVESEKTKNSVTTKIVEPGLFLALDNGRTDAVKAYLDSILKRDLFNDQPDALLALLKAESKTQEMTKDGVVTETNPGLFAALTHGRTSTVRAYVKKILASKHLTRNQKVELLKAENSKGISGLFGALKCGYVDLAKDFVEMVMNSDELSSADKMQVLKSQNEQGDSGLLVALCHLNTKTVAAYIQIILENEKLSQSEKLELVQAPNYVGVSGLFLLKYCQSKEIKEVKEMIEAYTKMVLESNKLNDVAKFKFLISQNKSGTLGLLLALKRNMEVAVEEYMQMILGNTKLSTVEKVKLLQARDSSGESGLAVALSSGYHKTVKVYVDTIKNSQLPEQDKNELLKEWYSYTHSCNDTATVSVNPDTVKTSATPDDQQSGLQHTELLLPESRDHLKQRTLQTYAEMQI